MLRWIRASLLRFVRQLKGEQNVLDYICGSESLPLPFSTE